MKLRECLEFCTLEELREIARLRGLRGYSSLNKGELIEFIAQNIARKDATMEVLEEISDSMKFLLDIIASSKGYEIPYFELREKFKKKYSDTTFYKALNSLKSLGLIYEYWEDDESFVTIPLEIAKFIKPPVREKEEKTKEEKISSLQDILNYASVEDLKYLLEEAGLKKSGNKTELIDRIINETGYTPDYILSWLFTKDELIEICRKMGLSSTGDKTTIINKILGEIGFKEIKKPKKISEEEKEREKLFKEVYKLLEDFSPYKPRDEGDIEREVFRLLKYRFEERGIPVVGQAIGVVRGKTRVPDIVVGKSVVVELKYIRRSADFQKALGQAVVYQQSHPYVILYCYDPEDRCGYPPTNPRQLMKLASKRQIIMPNIPPLHMIPNNTQPRLPNKTTTLNNKNLPTRTKKKHTNNIQIIPNLKNITLPNNLLNNFPRTVTKPPPKEIQNHFIMSNVSTSRVPYGEIFNFLRKKRFYF